MEKEEIFRAVEDGSFNSKPSNELNKMLLVLAGIGGTNTNLLLKASQHSEIIRHTIALRNHKQTLLWAKIAGIAAVIGAVAALIALFPK